MSDIAMSNETDLDWLARNVHVWPNQGFAFQIGHEHFKQGGLFFRDCLTFDIGFVQHLITRDQWIARRAELQGKPSWAGAPVWSNWLGQTPLGCWAFFNNKPIAEDAWILYGFGSSAYLSAGAFGCVLGDWRDTLERRPVSLSDLASSATSVAAATDRLTEATQTVLAAVPALMDEKYSFEPEFKPVTVTNETVQLEKPVAVAGTGNGSATESAFLIGRAVDLLRSNPDHFSADELADLHQLCDAELTKRDAAVCGGQKYLDAHWFERGELPPVGTACEYTLGANAPWYQCEIKYVIRGDGVVMKRIPCGDEQYCGLHHKHPVSFRPIRTEREELESLLRSTALSSFDDLDIIAGAIIAAGFRKEQK